MLVDSNIGRHKNSFGEAKNYTALSLGIDLLAYSVHF